MTENTTETPILSPRLLLIVSGVSILVALGVAFTQPTFTVIGWGAIVVAVLSLIGWIILDPKGFLAFMRGRNVAFGGISILVTILLITAMIAVYTVVRGADLRYDLTQKDEFSLSDGSRAVISAFAADPNQPNIKIIGFYDITQADNRDRDTVLLDDYVKVSNGKISYEFLDYDREFLVAEQYKVTDPGQLSVVAMTAEGEPDLEKAQLIVSFSQEMITNAILRAAASGDFRAYFLDVENGLDIEDTEQNGLSVLNTILTDALSWTTHKVSMVDLLSGEVKLDEPSDGTVLIIPGGSAALPDEAATFIQEYLNNGGDAVIMADIPSDIEEPALASAENMNGYFAENYGVSFNPNIVLDDQRAYGSPARPIATDFDTSHPLGAQLSRSLLVFEETQHIIIAENPPENVTVTPLVYSSENAFTKTIQQLVNRQSARSDSDPQGPFVLAAVAENTATDSKVVFLGSRNLGNNASQTWTNSAPDIANANFMLGTLLWTTGFDQFFTDIPQIAQQFRLQDTPIFADTEILGMVNFVTLALPFAVLAIGLLVWWIRRDRALKES